MKFEIKSRYMGDVLFSLETESLRLCVEAAVQSGADLSRANLTEANLSRANLTEANLSRADLSWADLTWADLTRADLTRADLSWADLTRANLTEANLTEANLSRADLSWAKGIQADRCTPLRMLLVQPGKIRAYKVVTKEGVGPFNGGIIYEVGKSYSVESANTSEMEQCGSGINLATLDWCLRELKDDYRILIVEFTAQDIAAIPTGTDGKFRVHRCEIVDELDVTQYRAVSAG